MDGVLSVSNLFPLWSKEDVSGGYSVRGVTTSWKSVTPSTSGFGVPERFQRLDQSSRLRVYQTATRTRSVTAVRRHSPGGCRHGSCIFHETPEEGGRTQVRPGRETVGSGGPRTVWDRG